jgi:hypothetical protein
MNIEIEKKKNCLHVYVTVKARTRDEKMCACTIGTILEWFKKNEPQYDLGGVKIIKSPLVHNGLGSKYLSGEWIFELEPLAPPKPILKKATPKPLVKKAPPSGTTSKTASNPRKTKKKQTSYNSEV